MLVNIFSAKLTDAGTIPVKIEVMISSGIGIHLVGLVDTAVKESLLRTFMALESAGFAIPGKKIVINIAPADIRKKDFGYDLPIAVGIIAASGQMKLPLLEKFILMGELGLDGSMKSIPGALQIAEMAAETGMKGYILPLDSVMEASGYDRTVLYGVSNLEEALRVLSEQPCENLLVKSKS